LLLIIEFILPVIKEKRKNLNNKPIKTVSHRCLYKESL
jgi:hypothetical protein